MASSIGSVCPDFELKPRKAGFDSMNGSPIPGGPFFASQGLHAGMHDRARYMAKLKPEFDKRHTKILG